jgi:hypothetical protein
VPDLMKVGGVKLERIEEVDWDKCTQGLVFIAAAGFEDRVLRGAERVRDLRVRLTAAVTLEFRHRAIPANDAHLAILEDTLRGQVRSGCLLRRQIEVVESLWGDLSKGQEVLIDISGMPHSIVLRTLRSASHHGIKPIVLYTEAATYYPAHEEAMKYLKYSDNEMAFYHASQQEDAEVMYAGMATVNTIRGYEGRLSPTEPTVIILFPTFKRTRTSAILGELEVQRKVFFIGKPVRRDLRWRMRAMEIINFDLIDPTTDLVRHVSTLSPVDTYSALTGLFAEEVISPRHNVLIAPHGSKMQTIGVWLFCEANQFVRAIASYPREYFPAKYSVGWRESFVCDLRTVCSDL